MKKIDGGALVVMTLSLAICGCGKENAAGNEQAGKEEATKRGSVQEVIEKKVEGAMNQAEAKAGGALFDKKLIKQACEILSPALIEKTFGVPGAELKQFKIMGCTYSWNSKGADKPQILEAGFTTIMAHKTEEAAKRWFEIATKGMTEEEQKKVMGQVAQKTKERVEVDTKAKEKVVDNLLGAMGGMSKGGIQFEAVSGVGDEAKFQISDGGLWIRLGNLTFVIAAYHGEGAPTPDFKGVSLQEMSKLALENNQAWKEASMPKRKKDTEVLAKAVLAALPGL